jgi:hypothetical protein
MSRFHVDTAGALETVRQAINAAWRATPAGSVVTHMTNGVVTHTEPLAAYELRLCLQPTQVVHASRLIVAGADAALEIPDTGKTAAAIAPLLGAGGVPSAAALVQVPRARAHNLLPLGVRDVLDDRWIDGEWGKIGVANGHANEAAARAAIIAELQGGRATAALARKDARGSQGALAEAMGIGRSQ